MQRSRQAHAGFTLTEVLIAVFIAALMGIAIDDLFLSYGSLYNRQQARIDTAGSAAFLLREVHLSALQADKVAPSHTFGGITYTSGTTTLVLEIPSIDSSGDTISGDYDYVGFYASSTDAYEWTDANGASARKTGEQMLSNTISSLSFTYGTVTPTQSTYVHIDAVTKKTAQQETLQSELQQTTYLRNF